MRTTIKTILISKTIKILSFAAFLPVTAFAVDSDNDGWTDEVDLYPFHRVASQPMTNVLLQHGFNAESNTEQWQPFNKASVDGITEVKETIGHDGTPTLAFHLQPTIVEAQNRFGFDGPTHTIIEGQEVNHVRISAWVKVEGVSELAPSSPSLGISYTSAPHPHPTTGDLVSSWGRGRLLRNDNYYNKGWVYTEWDFSLNAPAETIAMKIQLEQQVGYDFWIDDLELNFISTQNFDNDDEIDAIDSDDDNDGIPDGEDDTPLAELSVDIDADGIIDGYDDDLDNDGIVNALDNMPYMPYVKLTSVNEDNSLVLTAQHMEWPSNDAVDYIWIINELEYGERGNSITIDFTEYDFETEISVSVSATDGETYSAINNKLIVTPANNEPILELEIDTAEGLSQFQAIATDIDGHQLHFIWSLNGVEQVESGNTFTVDYRNFERGESLMVLVAVTDGYATVEKVMEVNIPANQLPEITLEATETNDTILITSTVHDPDGDDIEYTWFVNNELQSETGSDFTITNSNHDAGKTLNVKVTVTDGYDDVSQSISVVTPDAPMVTEDESSSGGGSMFYILTLLASILTLKRIFN